MQDAHPCGRHSALHRGVGSQRIVQGRHHKAERATSAPPWGTRAAFGGLRLPLQPLGGLQGQNMCWEAW